MYDQGYVTDKVHEVTHPCPCLQVAVEESARPMQIDNEPMLAPSLPKRRKTNNVIGVGVVSPREPRILCLLLSF